MQERQTVLSFVTRVHVQVKYPDNRVSNSFFPTVVLSLSLPPSLPPMYKCVCVCALCVWLCVYYKPPINRIFDPNP